MNDEKKSAARYVISSAATWLTDFLVFMAAYKLLGIPVALILSRSVAAIVGFSLHKYFSFQSFSNVTARELLSYAALVFLNYLMSLGLFLPFLSADTVAVAAIKIVIEVILFLVNYLFLRRVFAALNGLPGNAPRD